jgi:hypothetical protein
MKTPKYIIEAARAKLANNYYSLDDPTGAENIRDAIAGLGIEISELSRDSIERNKGAIAYSCRIRVYLTSMLNDLEETILRKKRRAEGLELARIKAREILAKARAEMNALIKKEGLDERDVNFEASVNKNECEPGMCLQLVDYRAGCSGASPGLKSDNLL